MTLKRAISQEELAKLDSFAIVVSSGDKFYIGLIQLCIDDIRSMSEDIVCNSIEEAILKARVVFPSQILIDVMTKCQNYSHVLKSVF